MDDLVKNIYFFLDIYYNFLCTMNHPLLNCRQKLKNILVQWALQTYGLYLVMMNFKLTCDNKMITRIEIYYQELE